jgi:hypothetical protein
LTSGVLGRLLSATRNSGRSLIGNGRFDAAEFVEGASFGAIEFTGITSFFGTRFQGDADFSSARFHATVSFAGASFAGSADFSGVQFSNEAGFSGSQFNGNAHFVNASFAERVSFGGDPDCGLPGARFAQETRFTNSVFDGEASFGAFDECKLAGAEFGDYVNFQNVHFGGLADFDQARFVEASLAGSKFNSNASFRGIHAAGLMSFDGASFKGKVWFNETNFDDDAYFEGATFGDDVEFGIYAEHEPPGAHFGGNAIFDRAHFMSSATFDTVRFNRDALFRECNFGGWLTCTRTEFDGNLSLNGACFAEGTIFRQSTFGAARFLGPMAAGKSVLLEYCSFNERVLIEIAAPHVSFTHTRFTVGANIRLRHAAITLDGAEFGSVSTLAKSGERFSFYGAPQPHPQVQMLNEEVVLSPGLPRITSVRNVDLATLVVVDILLAPCWFTGAHNIDKLRIEGSNLFALTPRGLKFGWTVPPVWWWTRRQTLVEEHAWRASLSSSRRACWHPIECRQLEWVKKDVDKSPVTTSPGQVTTLYRSLRKAQEDSKNEPGAADFYYGEMEMRRADHQTPLAERVILWLYWLVSGYGLRGLRALFFLIVVVLGAARLLEFVGFNGSNPSFQEALIYSAQSAISMTSNNKVLTERINSNGEALQIALRLIGPVLIGLALLSLRNRVKR